MSQPLFSLPIRYGIMLAAFSHGTLHAQPASTATPSVLDTVVVTASGTQQPITDAPASISVITREELAQSPYSNALDAVERLQGINIVGGSTNGAEISIRGMPGEYTLILVDGKRQNTRETMARDIGGVQPYMVPPLQAIERIEVVRGPMSALYGADAMGGVVNIITRKVPDTWHGGLSVGGVLQQHSELGNSGQGDFWVGGPIKENLLGLRLFGGYGKRSEDSVYFPASGTGGSTSRINRSLNAQLTLTPTANQEWRLDAGTQEFIRTSTPGRTAAPSGSENRVEYARQQVALSHSGRWRFGDSKLTISRETGKETRYTDSTRNTVRPKVINTILDASVSLPLSAHHLTIGGQFSRSELQGISQQAPIRNYPSNTDRVAFNAWALFLEDEWDATDQLTLTGGIRMDHDARYGSHWSPRLYGIYRLDPQWTLRAGIAGGFKAPGIRQSTNGYCVTTGLPGNVAVAAQAGTLCGNGDLKPETSLSQELGIRHDLADNAGHITATLFHTDLKNKVASYNTGIPDPLLPAYQIYVYDNISRVKLRGLELEAAIRLDARWSVTTSYTYTHSRRRGDGEPAYDGSSLDGQPLEKTPRHTIKAQVDWLPNERISAYARATIFSRQYNAGFRNSALNVRSRPGSATFDLGGSWRINSTWTANLALLNLADRRVPVDSRGRLSGLDGNWLVDEGRRLWLSLNAEF